MRIAGLVSLALLLVFGSSALADDEKRRETLALEVMELTGMPEVGEQVAASLVAQMKPAFPTVPDELWNEIGAESSQEIVTLSIPPYVNHFTEQELEAMVDLYKSPLGQAILQKMPAVQYEITLIGRDWGGRKPEEIVERLKAAGHEPSGPKPTGPEPAAP